jgi:glutathione S-transferase
MSDKILFSFRRCPYAIRARLALNISNINYNIIEVDLKNKPAELLSLSPKGQVPVLKLVDGKVIDESFEIMLWAFKQSDPKKCLPKTSTQWEFCKKNLELNDNDFKKNLDICKYQIKYGTEQIQQAKKECEKILVSWDKVLEHRKFLHADNIGLIDLAIFPFVRQFSKIKPDIFKDINTPFLKAWLDKITATPLFAKVISKIS